MTNGLWLLSTYNWPTWSDPKGREWIQKGGSVDEFHVKMWITSGTNYHPKNLTPLNVNSMCVCVLLFGNSNLISNVIHFSPLFPHIFFQLNQFIFLSMSLLDTFQFPPFNFKFLLSYPFRLIYLSYSYFNVLILNHKIPTSLRIISFSLQVRDATVP